MDAELTILKPDVIASPSFLSRKTQIPLQLIETILSQLAHESKLNAKFYLFCLNEDPELVHGYEFTSKKELRDFIIKEKFTCPNCNNKLNTQNIRVGFVKKEFPYKTLEETL